VEPIRQARGSTPVSLFEMDREQAERERDRMADEHPEATWLVAEQQPGDWAVVKVGLPPAGATQDSIEARPKPGHGEDPRSSRMQNPYGNF
jgi:hypothetical protein